MTVDLGTLVAKAIEQGGAVIVALFAIWVLRGVNELRVQEQKARAEEQKAHAEQAEVDKKIFLGVIQENTKAISANAGAVTMLTGVLERNTAVVGNCERAQEAARDATKE